MTSLLLAVLLFSTPFTTDKHDDDKDKGDDTPVPALMRHTPDYPIRYQPNQRGKIYFNLGAGVVRQYFNNDGNLSDLGDLGPADRNAEITELVAHVGGTYDVARIGDLGVAAGVDVSFADITTTADGIDGLPAPANLEADVSSDFTAQNVTVFAEIMAPNYRLRGGYLRDLGPEGDLDVSADGVGGKRPNTDEQDALILGFSLQYPSGSARLFAGADYFLTFEGEADVFNTGSDVQYDYGDILNLHAGVGVALGAASEVGVTVLYRINTEGEIDNQDVEDADVPGEPNQFRTGNLLSVVPYITFAQPGSNVQFYLKGAVQREYHDYGFSILGENDFAPRIGATLGVVYGF